MAASARRAPLPFRVYAYIGAVVAAALLLLPLSARAGGTPVLRAIGRNVAGGLLAMGVTYWIGRLIGHTLG